MRPLDKIISYGKHTKRTVRATGYAVPMAETNLFHSCWRKCNRNVLQTFKNLVERPDNVAILSGKE